MRVSGMVVAAALALAGFAPAEPDVKVEPFTGGYRLTLTAPGVSDVAEARRLLEPHARDVCGQKPTLFGAYRFETQKTLARDGAPAGAVTVLTQEIECGLPQLVTPPVRSAPDAPKNRDDAVLDLAGGYFDAVGRGDWAAAWERLGPGMQGTTTFERWSQAQRDQAARAGPRASLRFAALTWYDNPLSAPTPGLYGAIDYVATYKDGGFECGYVVARLEPDGAFRLIRQEQNLAAGEVVAGADALRLAQMRRDFHCVE